MSIVELNRRQAPDSIPVLSVEEVCVDFDVPTGIFGGRSKVVHAVQYVSFTVPRGTCFAIVGESGSGKTTLARTLVGLCRPMSGRVLLDGAEIHTRSPEGLRRMRRRVQMVLQDPRAAIDPRMSVRDVLYEALKVHKIGTSPEDRNSRVETVIQQVGLSVAHLERFSNELSGGQRQRVAIARAVICEPEVLILDEPVSALDVSVQAQIINLLVELQDRLGLTYVLITHDLSLVGHMADLVGVMYLGRFVEQGPCRKVIDEPAHPYTSSLLAVVASDDPAEEKSRSVPLLEGNVPSPLAPPTGCAFHTRCPRARAIAADLEPHQTIDASGRRLPRMCVEKRPSAQLCGRERDEPVSEPARQSCCHFVLVQADA